MTQTPNEQSGVGPIDLVALARHAMTLSHEAERAWSRALDPEAHSSAIDDLNARWSALLLGFHEAVSSAEARLAAEGHVMTLEEWPPRPETAASLDLAADDPLVRYRQLQIAQILAIEQLARALGALTGPTNSRIAAMSHEQYWSSGGFERVRTLGGFVMRVADELSQCEAMVIPSRPISVHELLIRRAFDSIELAGNALARGDTDAALLHAVRAAYARLAGLQDNGALEPSFSWKSLQGLASMYPTARLLQLAEEVAQNATRSSAGSGVTVPLAHALVPLVGSLVHRPPIDELRVHFTDTFLTTASADET